MGKLTVQDIEDRAFLRILKHYRITPGNDLTPEQAIHGWIESKDLTIARQAGQIATYQREVTETLRAKCERQEALIKNLTSPPKTTGTELWLISVNPQNVIQAIKLVQELTGLGLKEAKDLIDKVRGCYYNIGAYQPAAPQKISLHFSHIGKDMNHLVKRFAEIGATVEIR